MNTVPFRPARRFFSCRFFCGLALALASATATGAAPPASAELSFADLADLVVGAPIVATVRVTDALRLKDQASPPGTQRYYVAGDVMRLLRGSVPAHVAWLADLPVDARGRTARLAKTQVLLVALPGPRPGELRLPARDAMLPWSAELEARVHDLVAAAVAPDAPPRITGIASVFYSPGNLPGEGETQIFLATANGRPVSLDVLRRPGQPPAWSVAFGEIVDEAAKTPAHGTLAWYRLACFLPPSLPATALTDLDAAAADSARADYGFVLDALGRCERHRG